MDQARMDRTMSRIEAALARIERTASQDRPSRSADGGAHSELKERVQSALRELDGIIAEIER